MGMPGLSRFGYFTGLDTTGADFLAFRPARRTLDANGLQIRIETTTGAIVRVRDIISELRAFAANFASLSHDV